MNRKKKTGRFFSLILLTLVMTGPQGWSAEAVLNVTADPLEVTLGESLKLKFEISIQNGGLSINGPPKYSAPGFELINSYNSQQSEMQSINGAMSVTRIITLVEVLQPTKEGSFRIQDLSVSVNGQSLVAAPINVKVVKSSPGGGSGSTGIVTKSVHDTNFFVKAEVNKTSVYKGEQLVVDYSIYTRTKLFDFEITKFPLLGGFLRKDLKLPILNQRPVFQSVIYNGKNYQKTLLARYAAYPVRDGEAKIDPIAIQASAYAQEQGSDDPFSNDPFFGQLFRQLTPVRLNRTSESVTVKVKPLPTAGKPEDFSGAVGVFQMNSAVSQYEIRAHQPLELVVNIEGQGNVSAFEDPVVNWPEGVEQVDKKSSSDLDPNGEGKRIIRYTVIPRKTGNVVLPEVVFSFFDPNASSYKTLKTDSITLNVLEGNRSEGGTVAPPTPSENFSLKNGLGSDVLRGVWKVLISLTLILFLGFLSWVGWSKIRRTAKGRRSVNQIKAQRGAGNLKAKDVWEQYSRKAQTARTVSEAYSWINEGLLEAIESVYAVPARALTRSELGQELIKKHGLPLKRWEEVAKFMDEADEWSFSGRVRSADDMQLPDARKLIEEKISLGDQIIRSLQKN